MIPTNSWGRLISTRVRHALRKSDCYRQHDSSFVIFPSRRCKEKVKHSFILCCCQVIGLSYPGPRPTLKFYLTSPTVASPLATQHFKILGNKETKLHDTSTHPNSTNFWRLYCRSSCITTELQQDERSPASTSIVIL